MVFIIYYYNLLTTSLTQGGRIWDSKYFFIEGPNNKLTYKTFLLKLLFLKEIEWRKKLKLDI